MELKLEDALRYIGGGENGSEELRQAMAEIAQELNRAVKPRRVYRIFPLAHESEEILLKGSGVGLKGKTARKMLAECERAALLACTLGAEFDTMLRAEQARDMSRAVMLDACGSALAEAACDEAETELAALLPGLYLTDRFSPGYGDLTLDIQPAICAALNTGRRLGLYVSDSLMLNPSKSVTAVIGIADRPQMARVRGCGYCLMNKTCTLRKEGKSCAI